MRMPLASRAIDIDCSCFWPIASTVSVKVSE